MNVSGPVVTKSNGEELVGDTQEPDEEDGVEAQPVVVERMRRASDEKLMLQQQQSEEIRQSQLFLVEEHLAEEKRNSLVPAVKGGERHGQHMEDQQQRAVVVERMQHAAAQKKLSSNGEEPSCQIDPSPSTMQFNNTGGISPASLTVVDASDVAPLPLAHGRTIRRPPAQPGAFPQAGFDARSTDDGRSLQFGDDSDEEAASPSPPPASNDGLVEAMPVTLPTETAEPFEVKEPGTISQHDESKRKENLLLAAPFCLCILLLLIVGVALRLSGGDSTTDISKSDHEDQINSNVTSNITDNTTTLADDSDAPWTWDLPFPIPNSTLHTLQADITGTTPQTKAYLWMKDDPHLANYSEDRLLQRFVMATFYYATLGETWRNQGDESDLVFTIVTDSIGPGGGDGSNGSNGNNQQGNRQLQAGSVASCSSRFLQNNGTGDGAGGGNQSSSGAGGIGGGGSSGGAGGQGGGNPGGGGPGGDGRPPQQGQMHVFNISSDPWLSYNSSECEWFSTAETALAEACNENQTLTFLGNIQNDLKGSLPAELGLLTSLEIMSLMRNSIKGPLIKELASLSNLWKLALFSNQFTGPIPSQLGLLSDSLSFLALFDNQLTGTIPEEIWKLSRLTELRLQNNKLEGHLPSDIGNGMPHLEKIELARNHGISGTIPSSLGLMTGLQKMVFHDCSLSGHLPSQLGMIPTLREVFIKNNKLIGTIPSEFGLLPLRSINLDGNQNLGGTIPLELQSTNNTLRAIKFKGTNISGTIPEGLCGVNKVEFDCSPSFLCGCDCLCST